MEARPSDTLPAGPGWQYEPKWDGFRCLLFRDHDEVSLQSKSGQPLARYFPEIVAAVRELPAARFVLDGELVVPVGDGLSFDDLLQRIHPAESRVARLARERPARLVVFDLLVDANGTLLTGRPLSERRRRLETFATQQLAGRERFALSPVTPSAAAAARWFHRGRVLDGVVAKRLDAAYASGERTAMVKVKRRRTADCVVGGFRYASSGRVVGSLLLGLYDAQGRLHHVGFTSSLSAAERRALTPELERAIEPPGFTGRAPGGPSRWSRRAAEWHPLAPALVVEVEYDHVSGGRFRHGTRLLRRRPDKSPRQCRLEQIDAGRGSMRALLRPVAAGSPATRRGRHSRAAVSRTAR